MISAWEKLRGARGICLALVLLVAGAGVGVFCWSINPENFLVTGALDLRGQWEFHNGPVPLSQAPKASFSHRIEVPKPMPPEIRNELATEFWYRRPIPLPSHLMGKDLGLSLGSVKGAHEVYWNGRYVGAGGSTGVRMQLIPAHFTQRANNILSVRVLRGDSLFPGIVHFLPMHLGEAKQFFGLESRYYFDVGLRPFVPATFRLALFFLFAGLFLAMPQKREYFSFSLFALSAALYGALQSKFTPWYEHYHLRVGLQFLFSTLALASLPWLTADFLRLPESWRSHARSFGGALALVFLGAALWAKEHVLRLGVYQIGNAWLPLVSVVACLGACAWAWRNLAPALAHRRAQIAFFSLCLAFGALTWSSLAPVLMQYERYIYPELLDLAFFSGLAACLAMELRVVNRRSDLATRIVPKWVTSHLSSRDARVKMEIPMVVAKVDTVGYTRSLSLAQDPEQIHGGIRHALALLLEQYGAQKISDGGDGGIFGWDLPADEAARQQMLQEVWGACASLAAAREDGLRFRVGLAAGSVRCELRGGDVSFLGEALNAATRLETLAAPGIPLVDQSLVELVGGDELGDWVEKELKGVIYRARPLKLSA